ncbi:hypothetical protein [Pseudanabaena sp. UWO310]|uniref:hypothetical protein n=1 Tax=Pseudanabaena sp. UWO310 TaxID=2480795 RepID=UPI001CC1DE67|nr:hypothetical protein [Pseudanabaena sp. UWO310]
MYLSIWLLGLLKITCQKDRQNCNVWTSSPHTFIAVLSVVTFWLGVIVLLSMSK